MSEVYETTTMKLHPYDKMIYYSGTNNYDDRKEVVVVLHDEINKAFKNSGPMSGRAVVIQLAGTKWSDLFKQWLYCQAWHRKGNRCRGRI